MRLLAIETATPASSVALGIGRDVVASADRVDRRGHGAFIVSALDFCFDQVGWRPHELDAIVIDVGPGLYTGIRVGLATAQGLAAALGVPLVPLSSLDVIALRAATHRRHVWSVVDVRRNELAVASYQPVPGGVVKDGPPQLVTVERFRAVLQSDPEDALVVGDGASLPEGFFHGLHRVKSGRPQFPAAEAMLELAVGRVEREEFPHADEVRPLYLREPDVTISWKNYREEGPWAEPSPA
ncbi:MAG: tRNA (adenosine(37)-N6)-threonylcarbamoyltransferase complex dimerization subunit type 1 TsaB [Acidimicrobiia bacterium]|nr:tRNA (adenosine(37)-N6)-threonylcarbamoyltransferase complex dimerization subunit type 1 TsaB [Acidimicrobiia bacterium]MDH3396667.1 tRNA (adenosine(37)-N6)-threonylcarbamoyltransferase complex dimerization subunit type 1 TsaB [Acidimicrobiia bacterium]MDH5616011.1 tRNA (adenosine(37)-N6)-threonylcarbamoyltransferase complex dimerization subunit type 1 TsaB [Acidimicrobiia bacterium]